MLTGVEILLCNLSFSSGTRFGTAMWNYCNCKALFSPVISNFTVYDFWQTSICLVQIVEEPVNREEKVEVLLIFSGRYISEVFLLRGITKEREPKDARKSALHNLRCECYSVDKIAQVLMIRVEDHFPFKCVFTSCSF